MMEIRVCLQAAGTVLIVVGRPADLYIIRGAPLYAVG